MRAQRVLAPPVLGSRLLTVNLVLGLSILADTMDGDFIIRIRLILFCGFFFTVAVRHKTWAVGKITPRSFMNSKSASPFDNTMRLVNYYVGGLRLLNAFPEHWNHFWFQNVFWVRELHIIYNSFKFGIFPDSLKIASLYKEAPLRK